MREVRGARRQRAVSWTQPAMNIDLEIEGIPDRTVTGEIRKRVRMLGRQLDRSEDWRVRLVPSETQAEWDLGIRTSSGWHVSSFTASSRRLADIVEQHLRVQMAVSGAEDSLGGR